MKIPTAFVAAHHCYRASAGMLLPVLMITVLFLIVIVAGPGLSDDATLVRTFQNSQRQGEGVSERFVSPVPAIAASRNVIAEQQPSFVAAVRNPRSVLSNEHSIVHVDTVQHAMSHVIKMLRDQGEQAGLESCVLKFSADQLMHHDVSQPLGDVDVLKLIARRAGSLELRLCLLVRQADQVKALLPLLELMVQEGSLTAVQIAIGLSPDVPDDGVWLEIRHPLSESFQ